MFLACQPKKYDAAKRNHKVNGIVENFDFELFKKYQNSNGILQLSNGYTVLSMSAPAWTIIINQGKRLTEKEFLEMIKDSPGEPSAWKPVQYKRDANIGDIISEN